MLNLNNHREGGTWRARAHKPHETQLCNTPNKFDHPYRRPGPSLAISFPLPGQPLVFGNLPVFPAQQERLPKFIFWWLFFILWGRIIGKQACRCPEKEKPVGRPWLKIRSFVLPSLWRFRSSQVFGVWYQKAYSASDSDLVTNRENPCHCSIQCFSVQWLGIMSSTSLPWLSWSGIPAVTANRKRKAGDRGLPMVSVSLWDLL